MLYLTLFFCNLRYVDDNLGSLNMNMPASDLIWESLNIKDSNAKPDDLDNMKLMFKELGLTLSSTFLKMASKAQLLWFEYIHTVQKAQQQILSLFFITRYKHMQNF